MDGLLGRLLGVWEEDLEGLRFTLASVLLALPLVGYAAYVYLCSLPLSALWPLVEASLAVLLLVPLHEALHFLAARALGVRCRWGFTVTGPTAIMEEGQAREAIAVALAPLVLLGAPCFSRARRPSSSICTCSRGLTTSTRPKGCEAAPGRHGVAGLGARVYGCAQPRYSV